MVASGQQSMKKLMAIILDMHKKQSGHGEISESDKRTAGFLAKLLMMIFALMDGC